VALRRRPEVLQDGIARSRLHHPRILTGRAQPHALIIREGQVAELAEQLGHAPRRGGREHRRDARDHQ